MDEPDSVVGLHLVVTDIVEARNGLLDHGVAVSDIRHMGPEGWKPGPHPERQDYNSSADFKDPDGNTWVLQAVGHHGDPRASGPPGSRTFEPLQGASHSGPWMHLTRRETEVSTIRQAASDFLAHRRIAVTGVSRTPASHGSNVIYRRLRERGFEVFAVNPNAEEVEGDRCYPNLRSIPGGVEAVVIGTRPDLAEGAVRECEELGIAYIWMHRSFGEGSVSAEAAARARERGLNVIEGGCPLMFDPTADPGHKIMRLLFTMTGKVPRRCDVWVRAEAAI